MENQVPTNMFLFLIVFFSKCIYKITLHEFTNTSVYIQKAEELTILEVYFWSNNILNL